MSEKDYIRQKNKHLPKIAEWVKTNATGDPVIPISVQLEERLAVMSDAEMAGLNLARDEFHGEWSYTLSPRLPDQALVP